MAGQRLSNLQRQELRDQLENELLDTDAAEAPPDEDLSTQLRGIKYTEDDNEPDVAATVDVQDRIRFSQHLARVRLQDPVRPRINPAAAGRPSPKKKSPPNKKKSPDRRRNMMVAGSFQRVQRKNFEDPDLVARAVCALRPDGTRFHGDWMSTEGTTKSKVFLTSFGEAFEVAKTFLFGFAGLTICYLGSCKEYPLAKTRIAKEPEFASGFTKAQLNAFLKLSARACTKTGGQTFPAYCEICLRRVSETDTRTMPAEEFIYMWRMCVIGVFYNHRSAHPDENNETVRMSIELQELYFHDQECDKPFAERSYAKAKRMYFTGGAMAIPIDRDLVIGEQTVYKPILDDLAQNGIQPDRYQREKNGLVENPFSNHSTMCLPCGEAHPDIFETPAEYQTHLVSCRCSIILVTASFLCTNHCFG